jgi:predicted nucleotidyltransferase component of viral defense system
MDTFVNLGTREQRDYFEQAAAKLGHMNASILQKDFWVCWTLNKLFQLNDIGSYLTFKGGTSLSKVYDVIKRFSEDIDISIERGYLGFGGDSEPEAGHSNKERQRRIEQLKSACQNFISDNLLPMLKKEFQRTLTNKNWTLALDPDDKDLQTISFIYPDAFPRPMDSYLRSAVKIEFGARADHWPTENTKIKPYLIEAFPDILIDNQAPVRVLKAERTFWEKATILHMLYHYPATKEIPLRMSRHYYDMYLLINSHIKTNALENLSLLERVAQHKKLFFRAAWAKYEEARIGTLRLTPKDAHLSGLKTDYSKMQPMFFEDPPVFEKIIEQIAEFEKEINRQ